MDMTVYRYSIGVVICSIHAIGEVIRHVQNTIGFHVCYDHCSSSMVQRARWAMYIDLHNSIGPTEVFYISMLFTVVDEI